MVGEGFIEGERTQNSWGDERLSVGLIRLWLSGFFDRSFFARRTPPLHQFPAHVSQPDSAQLPLPEGPPRTVQA